MGKKQQSELSIDEPVPAELDTVDFHSAWREWLEYRAVDRRRPLSPRGQRMALKRLVPLGPEAAVAAIEHSIAGEFQGIYPAPRAPVDYQSKPEAAKKEPSVWEAKERLRECQLQLEEIEHPGGANFVTLSEKDQAEARRLRGEIARWRGVLAGKETK